MPADIKRNNNTQNPHHISVHDPQNLIPILVGGKMHFIDVDIILCGPERHQPDKQDQ